MAYFMDLKIKGSPWVPWATLFLSGSSTYSHHSIKCTVLLNDLVWNFSKNLY